MPRVGPPRKLTMVDFQVPSHNVKPYKSHPFFSECRVLVFAMAVCGRFPFHLTSSGSLKFSWLSLAWAYWVLIYSYFATVSVTIFIEFYFKILGEKNYDIAINRIRVCVLLISVFVWPLSNWREWHLMADYVNNMDAFLIKFEVLSGKRLRLNRMRYFLIATIIYTPILALIGTYVERESLGLINANRQLFFSLVYCGASFLGCFVLCGQWTIWKVAEYLQVSLLKVASKSRRKINVSPQHIHKLKCIWVNGTELLIDNGRAGGLSILTWVLINSGLVVLGSYGFFRSIALYDYSSAIHHGLNTLSNVFFIVILCDIGYWSTKKMSDRIIAPLSSIDTTGLSELATIEVSIFLQLVALQPPIISCGGLITLSRSFMQSVLSNTLTYLVVLVQLKNTALEMGANSEPTSSNVTNQLISTKVE